MLYSVLQEHPSVSLPPIKEIRYWDEGISIPRHSVIQVFFSKHWHYVSLRKMMHATAMKFTNNLLSGKFDERSYFRWKCKYILGKRGHEWYQSLFNNSNQVTGDISPLYYHLPKEVIHSINAFNPSMKIIVCIREPIDRAWSKARMNLLRQKKRNISDLSFDEFKKYCEQIFEGWVSYEETIGNWKAHFKHVHVAIYDDLEKNPGKWYREICKFLEIEPIETNLLQQRINKGIEVDIPDRYHSFLFTQYKDEMRQLAHTLSNTSWLREYRKLLKRFT